MPNLAARSWIEIASLTPPTRHASSWQTSIASAWKSCLKTTRFWMCSPVATRTGAISRRMRACPRMSSGLVGSSIHQGSCAPSDLHRRDRLVDAPHLVGVHHQYPLRPELASDQSGATVVGGKVAADLHLHVSEARRDGLPNERLDLAVVVAEPAGRRRVRGVAGRDDLGLPGRAAASRVAQELERLLRCERVRDVAEVDAAHDLLRREIDEQLPQRLSLDLGPQIPDCVDDRGRGQVDRALLGADPPQLAVGDEATPEPAHVTDDPVQGAPDDERLERVGGGDAHLRAPTAREGQPVPLDTVVRVGAENDVRGRVVRIGVHRIRPVEPARRREPDIPRLEANDPWKSTHSRNNPMFGAPLRRFLGITRQYSHKDRIITRVKGRISPARREPDAWHFLRPQSTR